MKVACIRISIFFIFIVGLNTNDELGSLLTFFSMFLGWFYTLALLVADIQMTVSLHYICLARCQCFEDIYIATDLDLNQWAYDNAPALYDDPLLEKTSVLLSASEDLASKKRDAKRRYTLRMMFVPYLFFTIVIFVHYLFLTIIYF
jgi:hypothetical protein